MTRNRNKNRQRIRVEVIVAIITTVGVVISALIGILPTVLSQDSLSATPTASFALTLINTNTLVLTQTPSVVATNFQALNTIHPSLTPTVIWTLTPASLLAEFTDHKGISMVLVPESDFIMGSESGYANERPPHIVHLNNYYIDKYEVTNSAYRQCVDARICNPPLKSSSFDRLHYYDSPRYDNYPVVYINWEMANAYCVNWRGGGLPTEAQWEKAAKGTDNRLYPWGSIFNGTYLNYCDAQCDPKGTGVAVEIDTTYDDGFGDTAPIGIYPKGASPYGIYDMAGNVWEWVYDWYGEYDSASSVNPLGPISGTYRVLRGGSWSSDKNLARVTNRRQLASEAVSSLPSNIGFRCAKNVNP